MQCYKDELVLTDADAIIYFTGNNTSDLLNFKEKITGQTGEDVTTDPEIIVPSKYLSNF